MKKIYIKPLALAVELKMQTMLVVGSKDPEGMNRRIIVEEEVDDAY